MVTVNQLLYAELFRAREVLGVVSVVETPDERRERYLQSAAEAEVLAQQAPSSFYRDLCLCIAKFWRQAADNSGAV